MDSDDRALNSVVADDGANQVQQPVSAPTENGGTENVGATGEQDSGTEVSSFRFVSVEEVTVQRVESAMRATAGILARIDDTMVFSADKRGTLREAVFVLEEADDVLEDIMEGIEGGYVASDVPAHFFAQLGALRGKIDIIKKLREEEVSKVLYRRYKSIRVGMEKFCDTPFACVFRTASQAFAAARTAPIMQDTARAEAFLSGEDKDNAGERTSRRIKPGSELRDGSDQTAQPYPEAQSGMYGTVRGAGAESIDAGEGGELLGAGKNMRSESWCSSGEDMESQFEKEGTGPNVPAYKTIDKYVNNTLLFAFEKFTGKKGARTTFSDLWQKLKPMHMAPPAQLLPADKATILFQCLGTPAEEVVEGFRGTTTREEYIQLWKVLYNHYGKMGAELFALMSEAEIRPPADAAWATQVAFVVKLANAVMKVKRQGGDARSTSVQAWARIIESVPALVLEFRRANPDVMRDYGTEYKYIQAQPEAAFSRFYAWIVSENQGVRSLQDARTNLVLQFGVMEQTQPEVKMGRDPSKEKRHHEEREETADNKRARFVCPLDGKDHPFIDCPLSAEQRRDAFRRKRLCNACAQPGHILRECLSKRACRNCSEPGAPAIHHPLLCEKWRRGLMPERYGPNHRSRGGFRQNYGNQRVAYRTTSEQQTKQVPQAAALQQPQQQMNTGPELAEAIANSLMKQLMSAQRPMGIPCSGGQNQTNQLLVPVAQPTIEYPGRLQIEAAPASGGTEAAPVD